MTLDLDFGILLPSSYIVRHIIELDFFFEELVHLSFNWVFRARLHKRGCVVNDSHAVKIFVLPRVDSTISKVIIKQILSMPSIGNSIIN